MQLAVMKAPGHIPGGGFHYMLHPLRLESDAHARIMASMGYVIIVVLDDKGEALIQQANQSLAHQVQIAVLTEQALKALGS